MLTYTEDAIHDLAGSKSYDRGLDYVDRVTELAVDDVSVTATVHGTHAYRVRLHLDADLDGNCTCPWGQEGNFCKHCVAVALLLLHHVASGSRSPDTCNTPRQQVTLGRSYGSDVTMSVSDRRRPV